MNGWHLLRRVMFVFLVVGGFSVTLREATSQQPLPPDQQAAMILGAGHRAFNEKNLPVASERYREFLKTFGGHKDAPAARYGLALAILDQPTPPANYNEVFDLLRPVAENQAFPDRALAAARIGMTYRLLANQALSQAWQKPTEAPQHINTANQQFNESLKWFAMAEAAFRAKAGAMPVPDNAIVPSDWEWVARVRCDQAEAQIRLNKLPEAAALLDAFEKEPTLARSKYRPLSRYLAGYLAYAKRDFLSAGKQLSLLAPFGDPVFSLHARYLLARVHHQAGERAEAAPLYDAILTDYDAQITAAKAAAANPAALAAQPEERTRLDLLLKAPPPDYVARAALYQAVLLYEQDRFADAADKLTNFPKRFPTSPLLPEAQLRLGMCQYQLKQFPEVVKSLPPLQDHPQLGDMARAWIGRTLIATADPANPATAAQNFNQAIEHFRNAAAKAAQLASTDPDAKIRRWDMLIEQGDAHQLNKQFKEAAAAYQTVLQEQAEPARAEVALQRQVTAWHLAAMYKESDDAANRFQQTYPKSLLLPTVLFRSASNAFALAEVAAAQPASPQRDQQLPPLYAEAIKRLSAVVEKFPEFAAINSARFALGVCHYRLGKYDVAAETLSKVPEAERVAELSSVSYVLGDCLIRTAPLAADDALAAGRLLQTLQQGARLLDIYVTSNPKAIQTPDALLKLGHCQQRIAEFIAEPNEKNQTLQAARATYDKLQQQFPQSPAFAASVFERAKVILAQNDIGTATNELNRFVADPLAGQPMAPIAVLRLATLLRAQNRAQDAANALQTIRQRHEGAMLADPARASWVPLLQVHQGIALKEANKLPEALAIFEASAKQFANKPEGIEPAWRAGQCRYDMILAKLAPARATLARSGVSPPELQAAQTAATEQWTALKALAAYFDQQIPVAANVAKGSEAQQRLYYEAAWCYRLLGENEVAEGRKKLRDDYHKRMLEAATKATPAGQPVPPVVAPEIALAQIPAQPAELKARELYKGLIAAADSTPLSLLARLELADVLAERGENDPALALVVEATDRDPAPELAENLHLRLGSLLGAKGDWKAAAVEFSGVTGSTDPARAADSRYRLAEALMQQKDFAGAVAQLLPLRDQDPWRNVAPINERALLRLGEAYALAGQWEPSRQAYEQFTQRYGQSLWLEQARFGMAWALQNLKQFDAAVNTYLQVTRGTVADVAAKAQLNIGLCRLEQQRWDEAALALQVVPVTYDYPQLSGLAMVEAGRAFVGAKKPEDAKKVLQSAVQRFPGTPAAAQAQAKLAEIK